MKECNRNDAAMMEAMRRDARDEESAPHFVYFLASFAPLTAILLTGAAIASFHALRKLRFVPGTISY